ncbi:hypothetical protein BDV34DRAFT_163859 [Aspergillus parasiticus]|uniref:Uncharacterized protein n=1 Tax=Aspergillus parasiticus TaxID=5067 RepID=A0A5N6E1E5_ASPPA|nr:hypothetical protein BDV34DRAFT_163859 [Aspergillus parasiticus]
MFERWSQKGLMLYQVGYRIRSADTKETEPLLAGTWFVASALSNLNTVPFSLYFILFLFFFIFFFSLFFSFLPRSFLNSMDH